MINHRKLIMYLEINQGLCLILMKLSHLVTIRFKRYQEILTRNKWIVSRMSWSTLTMTRLKL